MSSNNPTTDSIGIPAPPVILNRIGTSVRTRMDDLREHFILCFDAKSAAGSTKVSRRPTPAPPAALPPIASAPWMSLKSTSPPTSSPATASSARVFDVDVDDTRRIRLLAFIDASFFSPFMERTGKRYPDLLRRPAVVRGQHSVHDRLPVPHRYFPVHRPHRRWPLCR